MAKANKDGWIRHRGGKCPVAKGTLIDVRHRNGKINIGVRALEDLNAFYTQWIHDTPHKAVGEIMAYRLHTPAKQQEPKQITAEEIRMQYMENLSSIAMLHTKNAALVEDLRKLGFDFYEAPKDPQEDMSDPKNWRVGDYVKAINSTLDEFIAGDIYVIKELKWIAENHFDVYVEEDSSGSRENGWGSNNFVWHSRPTK